MPIKEVETPYPRIDADPHFTRVVRYFRPADYALWAGTHRSLPGSTLLLGYVLRSPGIPTLPDPTGALVEMADPVKKAASMRASLRMGGFLGAIGGFLLAYQQSSVRFWGWAENDREVERDFKELSQRAKEGKPLYGTSNQPEWVQQAAAANSTFSQLKFSAIPMFNFVNHNHHGTDPAKYGVQAKETSDES